MSVFTKGNTALISGGASGIGLAVAETCRRLGMNLALVDNNGDLLRRAKERFAASSSSAAAAGDAVTETYEMDVSKVEQWEELREKVKARFGGVQFLVLNAGIGLKGGWEEASYFQKVMDVNCFGQIYGINTILPLMQASGKPGTIVMTGSKQGITNPPGNPAYNASKAAVKSLAEHLSYDLRDSPLNVHLLVPGWTFTGLSGGEPGTTKQKPEGAWAPSQVADFLFEKMKKGKDGFWVLCPDNDVTEDKDRRRMLWTAGDAVNGRKPLSRWRDEYKDEAEEWMKNVKF